MVMQPPDSIGKRAGGHWEEGLVGEGRDAWRTAQRVGKMAGFVCIHWHYT